MGRARKKKKEGRLPPKRTGGIAAMQLESIIGMDSPEDDANACSAKSPSHSSSLTPTKQLECTQVSPAAVSENVAPMRLGTIQVSFLSGQCLTIPVNEGDLMSSVKSEVFRQRPAPQGMLPQLLHPDGILQGHEDVAPFLGIPLTALFTKLDLSDEARTILRRCTLTCPEDGTINFLEILWKLPMDQVKDLAQLLVQVQPRRLILHAALDAAALRTLANLLHSSKTNLEVTSLEVSATKDGIDVLTKLLRCCPDLQCCRLHNDGLTAALVKDLRSEIKASISI